MTKLLPLLTLLAATVPAAPLAAEPVVETRIVAVADLDLGTSSGRKALDHRLVRAAIEVCGDASSADLAGQNGVRACRVETLARARAAGDERVAALGPQVIEVAAYTGR